MTFIDSNDHTAIEDEADQLRRWIDGAQPRGLNVGLIYGGVSAEDQLYIKESPTDQLSVTALTESLTRLGTRHQVIDPTSPAFIADVLTFDVALSNLHGPYGEDGRLQGLMDYLRKPLCGPGVAACAIAADKILCKQHMTALGIPTPAWQVWAPDSPGRWPGHPVMIKPPLGGSSVGMSLVRDAPALTPALDYAWQTDPSPVLVEEYIPGLPVTVGLIELPGGILVFPPLATHVHAGDFYDAETKLDPQGTGTGVSVTPAQLPAPVLEQMTRHAQVLWTALGMHGSARVDFIVTDNGRALTLEVNTTPGMSRESNYVTGAALCGLDHPDVVLAFLHEALTRRAYDVPLPTPELTAPGRGNAA
ncbi:D-alanine--D-alanine ligase family protein [Streptomyces sp. NPDC001709]